MACSNVIIWGTGDDYEQNMNCIQFQVYKNELNIVAYVSNDILLSEQIMLDGKKLINPNGLTEYEYDYVIVFSKRYYKEIVTQALSIEIDRSKIINGLVFGLPNFTWQGYIDLLNSNPSIIAESCYGGYIYHSLGMAFSSPFINTLIDRDDYLKLLSNLKFYLTQPLTQYCDYQISDLSVNNEQVGYPIGTIGDVKIRFVHHTSFESAKNDFERHNKRVNWMNIWAFMIIYNDDEALKFSQLEIKNKLGFYYKECNYDSIVYLKGFDNTKNRFRSNLNPRSFVHGSVNKTSGYNQIDLIRLFSGKPDFLRYK